MLSWVDENESENLDHTASTSERTKSDKEDSNLPSGEEPEGTDGVSSEGEKAPGAEGMEVSLLQLFHFTHK